ncbi:MAG: hypothetical protein LBG84_00825, partial [Treponema sp.]|nr:hypothetical protein [Treponema sp.]
MTPSSTTPRDAASSSSKPPRGGGGGGGPSRAQTTPRARGGVVYFEAGFQSAPGVYHRVAWRKGETARVWLPPEDYGTLDKAILLAGRYDDRTLLATGKLTAADGGGGVTSVTADTTRITFTLTALNCEVKDADDGAFQITAPPSHAGGHGTASINGRNIPYFSVPKGSGDIVASLSVGGEFDLGTATGNPLRLNGIPWLASVGYATEGNPPARIDPRAGGYLDSGVRLLGDGGASLYTPPAGQADEGITAKLYLKTIGVDDGWCALAVDIPLTAYYDEANPEATAGHDVWRLRTGINYHQLDYGPVSAASYSPGGMTLLRVGNPAGGGILITGLNLTRPVLFRGASRLPVYEAGETLA